MKLEIKAKLESLALNRSIPFCYGCYKDAPSGVCKSCGSDDLMRHLPGVGVEYGTNWIVEHILETELTPVDLDDAFEEMIRGCYPEETEVGWLKVDTVSAMKELDPTSWDIAKSEWASEQESNDEFLTYDNGASYYLLQDLYNLLE